MRSNKLSRLSLLIAILGSASPSIFAIEAVTNPVGVIQITALGNSDTIISTPLKRPAVFNGVVASTAGKDLTAMGSPGWTSNEWINQGSYYAFMRSGTAKGAYATITANSANSITLDVDELTDLAEGDSFSIHPYWTLGLLFPSGAGLHSSVSHVERNSEIFIPDVSGVGVNLAAQATYYFLGGSFRKVGGQLNEIYDDAVLPPDSYFVLRHNIVGSTTVTFTGEVVMSDLVLPMLTQNQSAQDNIIGLQRPIEMSLNESGLLAAGFGTGDQLLVWNNAEAKKNRLLEDATVYTHDGAKWIKDGGSTDAGGDLVFTPGRGFIIRKAQGADSEVDWLNAPNYGN